MQVRRALEIDPASPVINVYVAGAFHYGRQFDQAAERLRKTLESDPDFGLARLLLARTLCRQFRYREAIDEFRRARPLTEGSSEASAGLGHALGLMGEKEKARKILRRLERTRREGNSYVSAFQLALVELALGDHDAVFELLQQACDERCCDLIFLKVDPAYDVLRADPRFQELLDRIGL